MKRQNPMRYARKMGVVLGENCRLIGLPDWGSEPWLISIGNHTEVSFDVAFITHDGATWCFRDQDEYKSEQHPSCVSSSDRLPRCPASGEMQKRLVHKDRSACL